jgi:hypothetical protein
MSKVLSPTLAIIGLSVGPALATNYHDYYPWAHPRHERTLAPATLVRHPYQRRANCGCSTCRARCPGPGRIID